MIIGKKRHKNENGYMLIEALIVTVIIALISIITIPSVAGLKSKRDLDRVVQMIVAEFSLA